ncbi:MAG: UDP-N-acetylmuramoyl-L-alanine--D-glutamate ligase [Lachnospiraceae bacterium]|nr:UDP-N-acetylmuramoyl-L-alanine--D-glutamate ligase [Lachnospiraceae bacterium]
MKGKDKILVVGAGKSGIAAASLLAETGKQPVLFDSNEELDKEAVKGKLGLAAKDIEIVCGEVPESLREEIGELVLSPGVPIDSPFVEAFRREGALINGEIELAFSCEKGTLIAITGTNGKTTTTSLVGKILNDYNHKTFVVGNIGNPYTGEVLKSREDTVTVAEISSFQLETADRFKPHISAILNLTPDHLNRHHTMEQYVAEKEKIARKQDENDFLILNHNDPLLREFGENRDQALKCKIVWFDSTGKLENGYYYSEGDIYVNQDGTDIRLINKDEMNIIGLHNIENAMASIAICSSFGVPMEQIIASLKEFKAVEHRIEFVKELDGVRYYNDSKGTNVDAAIKGIQAMDRRTVLIGGGYDKGAAFDDWIEAFDGKVKKLVLIGETAEQIAECAKKHGFTDVVFAASLKEAVELCRKEAKSGDAVLLSPACASWDMFESYEKRGELFKELVNSL